MSIHVIGENITAAELPSGYTRLEWIQSTGGQYIDTGISVPCNSEKVIIEFAPMEDNTSNDNPLTGHAAPAWSWDANLTFILNERLWTANTGYGFAEIKTGTFYKVEYTSSYCRVNDGTMLELGARTYVDGYNNTLFYASTKYGKHRVKSYKLYNGSTLVRDLVPCINPGGKVGTYDLVSKSFLGNSGTGEFIAGPANVTHEVAEVSVIDGGTIRDFKSGYVIENGTIYQVFGSNECTVTINMDENNDTISVEVISVGVYDKYGNLKVGHSITDYDSSTTSYTFPAGYTVHYGASGSVAVNEIIQAEVGDTLQLVLNASDKDSNRRIHLYFNGQLIKEVYHEGSVSNQNQEDFYWSTTITGNTVVKALESEATGTNTGTTNMYVTMEG